MSNKMIENKFKDYIDKTIELNYQAEDDTNIIIASIDYLEDVKELYQGSIISTDSGLEFRYIYCYYVIDNEVIQVYVTDDYKELVNNKLDDIYR